MAEILSQIATAESAGTLAGTEKVAVVGTDGLPKRTTAQAIADLAVLGANVVPSELALAARNESGGTLTAGTLVYVSGWDAAEARPLISKADSDVNGAFAQYLVTTAILNDANGTVARAGSVTGLDTSSTSVGDPVYLSAGTAGAVTKTAPTGADDVVQVVGRVTVVHASAGEAYIDLVSNPVQKVGTNQYQALSIPAAALAAESVTMAKLARGTNGQIIVANTGADPAYVTMSGDATLAVNGALTIASGAVTSTKVAASTLGVASAPFVPMMYVVDLANATDPETFTNILTTRNLRIVDVRYIKTGAAGIAGDKVAVVRAAGLGIGDDVAEGLLAGVTRGEVGWPTFNPADDTTRDVTAGQYINIRQDSAAGAGNNACTLHIMFVPT